MSITDVAAESLLGGLLKELAKESTRPPLDVITDSLPVEYRSKYMYFREFVQLLEDCGFLEYDPETSKFTWITN